MRSIFDDFEARARNEFAEAMKNLTEREEKMYAEYPEFFKKCKLACLNVGSHPMRVRKSGTTSRGTYVTGPVVSARPYRWREAARSVSCVFEAEIETTHLANGTKHRHTVYIRRLPK